MKSSHSVPSPRIAARSFSRGARVALAITALLFMCHAAASAATVVLKNGTILRGALESRSGDEITILDGATGRPRVIKTALIKELTLEKDEKNVGKGTVSMTIDDRLNRHVHFALGGGGIKIIDGPGKGLNFGFGGTFIFQYNYIVKGFGVDLHASYYYSPDMKYSTDSISILPVVASPMYRFATKYIDIDLRAGAGFSYTSGKSAQRLKLIPTGDPGQPLSAILVQGFSSSSFDLVAGAGVGISHTFGMGLVLGFEANYYYIFQSLSANAVAASIYLGYSF